MGLDLNTRGDASMDIGIGLPTYMRDISPDTTLEWARRAVAHNFASVGTLDRLVYANCDPLITLSAVAAVTRSVRLITTILISPYRNTAVLAKQAASLDDLSRGRLTLGVGLGGRAEDYAAAGSATRGRGALLTRQLEDFKRIWAGERRGFAGGIGPQPVRSSGPQLLVGGDSHAALRRMARWADGWVARAGGPSAFEDVYPSVLAAWRTAGRAGQPRTVALAVFGLGPTARDDAGRILGTTTRTPALTPNESQPACW
jgi:alkanesulfonate monooxygenase SsuD/methylene tetrahydromethanopterin reductase-like flavin-dependent oxidoreductase (luciferase family)